MAADSGQSAASSQPVKPEVLEMDDEETSVPHYEYTYLDRSPSHRLVKLDAYETLEEGAARTRTERHRRTRSKAGPVGKSESLALSNQSGDTQVHFSVEGTADGKFSGQYAVAPLSVVVTSSSPPRPENPFSQYAEHSERDSRYPTCTITSNRLEEMSDVLRPIGREAGTVAAVRAVPSVINAVPVNERPGRRSVTAACIIVSFSLICLTLIGLCSYLIVAQQHSGDKTSHPANNLQS